MNLGLAWALATPETESQNRQANFDIQNLKWYVPKGSPAISGCTTCITTDGRVGVQFDKKALEPRIGLSWKPMGNDKTADPRRLCDLPRFRLESRWAGVWQNPPYYAEVDPPTFLFGSAAQRSLSVVSFLPAGTPSVLNVPGGAVYNAPVNPSAYTGTIQSRIAISAKARFSSSPSM